MGMSIGTTATEIENRSSKAAVAVAVEVHATVRSVLPTKPVAMVIILNVAILMVVHGITTIKVAITVVQVVAANVVMQRVLAAVAAVREHQAPAVQEPAIVTADQAVIPAIPVRPGRIARVEIVWKQYAMV